MKGTWQTSSHSSGVAVLGIAGLIVRGIRSNRKLAGPVTFNPAPPPRRAVPPQQRPALPSPQIHLHLHGPVTAADVAEPCRLSAIGPETPLDPQSRLPGGFRVGHRL